MTTPKTCLSVLFSVPGIATVLRRRRTVSGWEARIPVGGEALRPSATSDLAPSNPQRASYSTGSLPTLPLAQVSLQTRNSQLVGTYSSSLHIPTRTSPTCRPPSHSPFLLGNLARCRSPASVVLLFLLHIAIANSNPRPHRHCSWRPFHFSPAPLVFVSQLVSSRTRRSFSPVDSDINTNTPSSTSRLWSPHRAHPNSPTSLFALNSHPTLTMRSFLANGIAASLIASAGLVRAQYSIDTDGANPALPPHATY